MTDGGDPIGLRDGTLALVPHDPAWASLFEDERRRIREALPEVRLTVDHIGSTAVPDLPAKPILDIAVRAEPADEDRVATALVRLGYIDRGIRSGRIFIRHRSDDVRTHNLHLYAPDDPDCRDQLTFRDALRADAGLRQRYAQLKRDLVDRMGGVRTGHSYADSKTEFVTGVLASIR